MKKTILLIASLAAGVSMQAQAVFNFINKAGAMNAPVTHKEDGKKVEGAAYISALYWGAKGSAESSFVPAADVTSGAIVTAAFRTGAAAGYIPATAIDVKGMVAGETYSVQMRAWSASGGATYEAAAAAALGGQASTVKLGVSNVFDASPTKPPATPATLAGLQAFPIYFIPEPSVLALGLLGGLAFLLRRR